MKFHKARRWGYLLGACCVATTWSQPMAQVQQSADKVHRELLIGNQEYLDFPLGIQRMAIADDAVVNIKIERVQGAGHPARVLLTPLKAGATSLMVWEPGKAAPRAWMLQVKKAVQLKQATYSGLPEMALAQAAASKSQGDQAAEAIDASMVTMKSNVVQVDVKVVEVNKTRLQQAGLNIFSTGANRQGFSFGVLSPTTSTNPSFGNGGALQGMLSSPFSQAFGLLMNFGKANIGLNLSMMEGNGIARVLAEPSLLAISGQSANFLAGGEVPIPVAQGNGAINIEYKTYGVGLTVSPTVLDNQRIVLKVAPESSELDYTNAVTLQSVAVPAITTRKADTTVELGDGESFVIGGLVSQSITSTVNRVPVLSQIPVLGVMFKRQEFTRKDRELVILVTPRLVKPLAAGVALDSHLPGASSGQAPVSRFWGGYLAPAGHSDHFPGFSQ